MGRAPFEYVPEKAFLFHYSRPSKKSVARLVEDAYLNIVRKESCRKIARQRGVSPAAVSKNVRKTRAHLAPLAERLVNAALPRLEKKGCAYIDLSFTKEAYSTHRKEAVAVLKRLIEEVAEGMGFMANGAFLYTREWEDAAAAEIKERIFVEGLPFPLRGPWRRLKSSKRTGLKITGGKVVHLRIGTKPSENTFLNFALYAQCTRRSFGYKEPPSDIPEDATPSPRHFLKYRKKFFVALGRGRYTHLVHFLDEVLSTRSGHLAVNRAMSAGRLIPEKTRSISFNDLYDMIVRGLESVPESFTVSAAMDIVDWHSGLEVDRVKKVVRVPESPPQKKPPPEKPKKEKKTAKKKRQRTRRAAPTRGRRKNRP